MTIKGYKAFNRDLQCRGFQFKEGETFEVGGAPELCENGFHFCKDLVLTLDYYPVDELITENRYAEVEALGDCDFEKPTKHKACTNKIRIVRIIPDDEVLAMIDGRNNSGETNSGYGNSGYGNSGNGNSGYGNSGNGNSGNGNSGNGNSGYWNSGYWNSASRETGHFNNTDPETIRVFGALCLVSEWEDAYKPYFLHFIRQDGESYKDAFQRSWSNADKDDRARVKALPNFDADIFFDISGIDLRGDA